MRVLFDTNVVLDALLAREPFVADAAFLMESVESGRVEGFISATTMTDVHYLVKRQTKSAEIAMVAVIRLMALMEICVVDREVLEQALRFVRANTALESADFEDAIQVACAIAVGAEAITTRDVAGFTGSLVPVLPPKALRDRLS
jgi:predicted nucleic acid-binding protein